MALERSPSDQMMVDLLDRVLDKGIVIDWAARFSAGGIPLMEMQAHFVVAAVNTYLQHVARPAVVRADQLRMVHMMPQSPS
jgi:hypothetical protein